MLDGNAIARAEREGVEDGVEHVCANCAHWFANDCFTAGICRKMVVECRGAAKPLKHGTVGALVFYADCSTAAEDECDTPGWFTEN